MSIQLELTFDDKQKAADLAVKEINKEYGDGAIFDMGDRKGLNVPVIPTGIYSLDWDALGVGGMPRGRIIELYGPSSSGKTSLALRVIAGAQKAGGLAAFIDAEYALDPTWAAVHGVNVDDLLISQPDYGEQAIDICERLVTSNAFDIIVIDSVAALTPKAEIEGDSEQAHMGLQARLMARAMRKLSGIASKSGTTLLFINQIREKIGVMFGPTETTPGGRSLGFYASVRVDVRRLAAVKVGEDIVGNKVKIKITKNKVAAPFKETEVDLLFESGFDSLGSLITPAIKYGIIERAGAWYTYSGNRYQGEKNLKAGLDLDILTKQVISAREKV